MSTQLLEIQPQELKFLFELEKQSSCSVRLTNKTDQHVAFKVKTTSPNKYCVRPNTGVMKPKAVCDFKVTMQAQRVIPSDMICKDKFLLQCAVVPVGTAEEDITSATFAKDKYVEEKKLKVILVSPPNSPIFSPVNGTPKHVQAYEAPIPILDDQNLNSFRNSSPLQTAIEDVRETKVDTATDLQPVKGGNAEELMRSKDTEDELHDNVKVKIMKDVEDLKVVKDIQEPKPQNDVVFKILKDEEELKLVKDIEEVKSKLKEFELKLNEAEVTISKLKEEKRLGTQDRESLQQELALMRSKRNGQKIQAGFPSLFVFMVALVSTLLGYLIHKR